MSQRFFLWIRQDTGCDWLESIEYERIPSSISASFSYFMCMHEYLLQSDQWWLIAIRQSTCNTCVIHFFFWFVWSRRNYYRRAAESTIYFRLLVSSLLLFMFVLPLRTSKIINELLRSFFLLCLVEPHELEKKTMKETNGHVRAHQCE